MDFQVSPKIKKIIQALTPEENQALGVSLKTHGCLQPLLIWKRQNLPSLLLDGHHRLTHLKRLKMPFQTKPMRFESEADALCFVIQLQQSRRNLSLFSKVELEIKKSEIRLKELARKNVNNGGSRIRETVHVDEKIAKNCGCGKETVYRVRFLLQHSGERSLTELRAGRFSLNEQYKRTAISKGNLPSQKKTSTENFYYSAMVCQENSDLMAKVSQMYIPSGAIVVDATYGEGGFWKAIDVSRYDFFPSDLITCPDTPYDFRDLPYMAEFCTHFVLDPPYVQKPGKKMIISTTFKNVETASNVSHDDILRNYRNGMAEAKRVLKPAGLLLVKCQDETCGNVKRLTHVELIEIATKKLGFACVECLIMVRNSPPPVQCKEQKSFRTNHSYLLIFRKGKN